MELSRRLAGYPQLNVRVPPELLRTFKASVAAANQRTGAHLTLSSVSQALIEEWVVSSERAQASPTSALLEELTGAPHMNHNNVVVDDAGFTLGAVGHLVDSRRSRVDVLVVNALASRVAAYAELARSVHCPPLNHELREVPYPSPLVVLDVASATKSAAAAALELVRDRLMRSANTDRLLLIVLHGIAELVDCGEVAQSALRDLFRHSRRQGGASWMVFDTTAPAYDDVIAALEFNCALVTTTNPEMTKPIFDRRVDRPATIPNLTKRQVFISPLKPAEPRVYDW